MEMNKSQPKFCFPEKLFSLSQYTLLSILEFCLYCMVPLPNSKAIASYIFETKYRYISILDYILIIVLRTNKYLHAAEACHPMLSAISIEIWWLATPILQYKCLWIDKLSVLNGQIDFRETCINVYIEFLNKKSYKMTSHFSFIIVQKANELNFNILLIYVSNCQNFTLFYVSLQMPHTSHYCNIFVLYNKIYIKLKRSLMSICHIAICINQSNYNFESKLVRFSTLYKIFVTLIRLWWWSMICNFSMHHIWYHTKLIKCHNLVVKIWMQIWTDLSKFYLLSSCQRYLNTCMLLSDFKWDWGFIWRIWNNYTTSQLLKLNVLQFSFILRNKPYIKN